MKTGTFFNPACLLTSLEPHMHGDVPGLDNFSQRSGELYFLRLSHLNGSETGEASCDSGGLGDKWDKVVTGSEGHCVPVGDPPSEMEQTKGHIRGNSLKRAYI